MVFILDGNPEIGAHVRVIESLEGKEKEVKF